MNSKRNSYLSALLMILFFVSFSYSQTTASKTENKSKLFEETATDSDYLMSIEKAGDVLQSAANDAEFEGNTFHLFGEIKRTESKLDLILASLKGANPNVRNQQMYRIVLKEIEQELNDQNKAIDHRNANLEKIKSKILDLRKDKTLFTLIKAVSYTHLTLPTKA